METTTTITTAQKISAFFDDDGQKFRAGGRDIWAECDAAGGRKTAYVERGLDAWRFADGSGIIMAVGGWDVAAGPNCTCWAGMGHGDNCQARER